jgi:pimeloyl-ACP methyl ester carboxylesterase
LNNARLRMRSPDQFIESGSVRLRVHAEGEGPPVLLVHGWALDLAMWQPQFAGLADRCRMIAFDRRGFGLSSGEPDIIGDVEDVSTVLDAFEIARVAIVGMSQGARVALRFGREFPQRVTCLILDGPPQLTASAADELPMSHYHDLTLREGLDAFRAQWLQHPFMRLHSDNLQAQVLLRDIVGRYRGRDLLRDGAAPPPPEPDLRALTHPVLIINGERDSAIRRLAGEDLARRLPNAHRSIVSAAGHLPNLDNPAVYNDLVSGFVRCHALRAA